MKSGRHAKILEIINAKHIIPIFLIIFVFLITFVLLKISYPNSSLN